MAVISFFYFFLLAIIVGVIIIIVIAYPKKYKRNVNKALQSGVPVKTIEPTILFGGIALTALIIMNIVLIASINSLKTDVSGLRSELSNVTTQLNYARWDISAMESTIQDMYEDTLWLDEAEYEIVELTDQGEAVVDITIRMNRVSSNGIITLVSETEDGVTEEVLISTNMIFEHTVTIDTDTEYEFSVMVTEGTMIESEQLFSINIEQIIINSKQFYMDEDELENGDIVAIMTVSNNYLLHSDLAFDSVEMIITRDDVEVHTETKTVPTRISGTTEYFEFEVNWFDYPGGVVVVTFIGTDGFGNEYEIFGEGFEVPLEE